MPLGLRRALAGLAIALSFVLLGALGYLWAKDDALAVLSATTGPTERDTREAVGAWSEATLGARFHDGDGARTGSTSRAHFGLASGALLTLKPASQIRFQQRGSGTGAIGLTVEVGEVDVRTKERTLTIDSQFGEVVIEPNSLIQLKRNGAALMMSVEVGGLVISPDEGPSRRLIAGESMQVMIGGIEIDTPGASQPQPGLTEEELTLQRGDGIDFADLVVPAGETFTVHDPRPPTAIGFDLSKACKGAARLSLGELRTEAGKRANLPVPPGKYSYDVRCLSTPEQVATSGQVTVLRDAGTQKLPRFTPTASVATDGRRYTVLYQSRLPEVTVTWPGAPVASRYVLSVNGAPRVSTSPTKLLTSGSLPPGTHQLTFSANTSPPRQSRTTTVVVRYDSQAPQARLSEPSGDFSPGSTASLSGQALPGWSVSYDGRELELDGMRQFNMELEIEGTVAVTFKHPERGIHYYLRRPRGPSR